MSLPERVALDASFIINVCEGVEEAKEALGKLQEARCRLLVPMPVWAEIARGVRHGGIGRMARVGVAPLALETPGAEFLGIALATKGTECGCGKVAWAYDAMIFACAVAGRCDMIVTQNTKHYDPFEKATGTRIVIATAAKVIQLAAAPPPAPVAVPEPEKLKPQVALPFPEVPATEVPAAEEPPD